MSFDSLRELNPSAWVMMLSKNRSLYDSYLRSEAWQQKRKLRLELDRFLCLSCGGNATEVHHLTYARVGDESIEDLLSFCHECHTIQHGREF